MDKEKIQLLMEKKLIIQDMQQHIIDDLDVYAHVKTDLPKNIRDEMISDVRAKLDHILGIISNSKLSNDDMIILTTDHGMQRVYNTTSFPRLDKDKFEINYDSISWRKKDAKI